MMKYNDFFYKFLALSDIFSPENENIFLVRLVIIKLKSRQNIFNTKMIKIFALFCELSHKLNDLVSRKSKILCEFEKFPFFE